MFLKKSSKNEENDFRLKFVEKINNNVVANRMGLEETLNYEHNKTNEMVSDEIEKVIKKVDALSQKVELLLKEWGVEDKADNNNTEEEKKGTEGWITLREFSNRYGFNHYNVKNCWRAIQYREVVIENLDYIIENYKGQGRTVISPKAEDLLMQEYQKRLKQRTGFTKKQRVQAKDKKPYTKMSSKELVNEIYNLNKRLNRAKQKGEN